MLDQSCTVGDGLARAMARADELRAASPRRVRVRIVTQFGDFDPGVIIVAKIPAKTNPELEAQSGKGVRYIPLSELDARAHELPHLVDEAAAEVEAAVASAPTPAKRPSQSEADFDFAAYEALIQDSSLAMLDSTKPYIERARALSVTGVGEALAVAALKTAALAALGAQVELEELVELLRHEYREIRESHGSSRDRAVKLH